MRLKDLVLPKTIVYENDGRISSFEVNLKTPNDDEAYNSILRYRSKIRDGLYVEISYSFSSKNLNDLISEKRSALDIFEEMRPKYKLNPIELNILDYDRKNMAEDVYIVCTDDTLPQESKLYMHSVYLTENFKVKELYGSTVKKLEINEFDKLESYTISFAFECAILSESLQNTFSKNGKVTESVLTTMNTTTQVVKNEYDDDDRLINKKFIINDKLIYEDKYRYDGCIQYCDMISDDVESHDINLLDKEKKPIICKNSMMGDKFSTEGITVFEHLSNGDIIIESINCVPDTVIEI